MSARKLSAADVLEIRASQDTVKVLAARYRVTNGAISQALHGTTYKGLSAQSRKLTEVEHRVLIRAASLGASKGTMCAILSVSRPTYDALLDRDLEFKLLLEQVKADSILEALRRIREDDDKGALRWLSRVCRDNDYRPIDHAPVLQSHDVNARLMEAIEHMAYGDYEPKPLESGEEYEAVESGPLTNYLGVSVIDNEPGETD